MQYVHRSKTARRMSPCRQVTGPTEHLRAQCGRNFGLEAVGQVGAHQAAQDIAAATGGKPWITRYHREELPFPKSDYGRDALQQNRGARCFGGSRSSGPGIELAARRELRKQCAKLSRVWSEHHWTPGSQRRELGSCPSEGYEAVSVEHDCGRCLDAGGDKHPSALISSETGTDNDSIRFPNQLQQRC